MKCLAGLSAGQEGAGGFTVGQETGGRIRPGSEYPKNTKTPTPHPPPQEEEEEEEEEVLFRSQIGAVESRGPTWSDNPQVGRPSPETRDNI